MLHKMNAHRGSVGMLAVLFDRIVWRKKSRAGDDAVQQCQKNDPSSQFAVRDHRLRASTRMRGSAQYSSKSARKLPATRKVAEKRTPPITM